MKFATFLKSSLLFNSFCCLFCLWTKLYGSITLKLEQLWMRIFQCLLFVLKRSYICYYIICMTVPLNKNNVIDCSAFLSDSSTKKIYFLRASKFHNSYISVVIEDCHECPQYEWNKHIQEYTYRKNVPVLLN